MKYVSKTKQAHIDKLIIKAGWILLTRSGSTGRATIALENWDGWAASEHIFRILPNEDKCLSGYLYAFLSSDLGQAQLQRSIYGAVVDELTEDHIREITVPIPMTAKHIEITKKIDEMAKTVCRLKYHAITLDDDAINSVSTLFDDDYNPNHTGRLQRSSQARRNPCKATSNIGVGFFRLLYRKVNSSTYL